VVFLASASSCEGSFLSCSRISVRVFSQLGLKGVVGKADGVGVELGAKLSDALVGGFLAVEAGLSMLAASVLRRASMSFISASMRGFCELFQRRSRVLVMAGGELIDLPPAGRRPWRG